MSTLEDLLTPQSPEQLFELYLGTLKANGFPVESWQEGGTERIRAMAFATALALVSAQRVSDIARGGLLDYSLDGWLKLWAAEMFEVPYLEAGQAVGNVVATVAAGAGPYTFSAGQLIAIFADTGNRYINTTGGTLSSGPSSSSMQFRSEFPGAKYNDLSNANSRGTSLTLVTPLPGVTLDNPAGVYSSIGHVGSGSGHLVLSGTPSGSHQVIIRIDTTGAAGAAFWSYSIDGRQFVSASNVSTLLNLGGVGINIILTNGTSGTSFVAGDSYTFACPGSWLTTQGSDDESDQALAQRCRDRWSTLSPIPTANFYELLARTTPGLGAQVTSCSVAPSPTTNNQVDIIVSGPAGPLAPAVIAQIQEYINARVPETDSPVVRSPATVDVTLTGTITVAADQLTAAQGAIQSAMVAYVNSVGINGTIRLAAITELVMEIPGVVDITDVMINGTTYLGQPYNLPLGEPNPFPNGPRQTFQVAQLQPLGFTYQTV